MTAENLIKQTPIYVSYLTFVDFLDWLKEMKIIPTQIDRSLWSGKFPGSNGSQLVLGLKFLGLLDEERPTEMLEPLVMTDDISRKDLLKATLQRAYGESMVNDLPRMTPGMLDKGLTELGTTAATHRKAVSFFVNASKAAGLAVPAQIARRSRNKPVSTTRPTQRRERPEAPAPKNTADESSSSISPVPETKLPEASQSLMLWGLFERLPAPGAIFAGSARDRWIEAAKAIFEVEYQPESSPKSDAASTPDGTGVLEGGEPND